LRIIQKYGGTSVADIARLENVALRIKKTLEAGHEVAVVVSAMAGMTNQLVSYTKSFSNVINSPEHDAVVSTGEQITTGLLSLALQQLGLKSRSFMGWQIPIQTTTHHTNARILRIDPLKLNSCLVKGIIPIIAGFQGITRNKRITTLGRGGSDTTAVAIAAALQADRCDIYTDVDGVYTADPRIIPTAKKLGQITYFEMLELAAQGAKVLHSRSVETALKHKIPVRVLSSFNENSGTDVIEDASPFPMTILRGITHTGKWVMIHLETEKFRKKGLDSLYQKIKNLKISWDYFSVFDSDAITRISFLVQKADFAKTIQALEKKTRHFSYKRLYIDPDFAKISLVGLGLFGKKGLTEQFLEVIKQRSRALYLIYVSNTRISFCVKEEYAIEMMGIFHTEFQLDQKE
jgi:aspartate kinase